MKTFRRRSCQVPGMCRGKYEDYKENSTPIWLEWSEHKIKIQGFFEELVKYLNLGQYGVHAVSHVKMEQGCYIARC